MLGIRARGIQDRVGALGVRHDVPRLLHAADALSCHRSARDCLVSFWRRARSVCLCWQQTSLAFARSPRDSHSCATCRFERRTQSGFRRRGRAARRGDSPATEKDGAGSVSREPVSRRPSRCCASCTLEQRAAPGRTTRRHRIWPTTLTNESITFSIVIPNSNRPTLIRRAVASCLKQRHPASRSSWSTTDRRMRRWRSCRASQTHGCG